MLGHGPWHLGRLQLWSTTITLLYSMLQLFYSLLHLIYSLITSVLQSVTTVLQSITSDLQSVTTVLQSVTTVLQSVTSVLQYVTWTRYILGHITACYICITVNYMCYSELQVHITFRDGLHMEQITVPVPITYVIQAVIFVHPITWLLRRLYSSYSMFTAALQVLHVLITTVTVGLHCYYKDYRHTRQITAITV